MWKLMLRYLVLCLLFLSLIFQVTHSLSLNSSAPPKKLCSPEDSLALLHFKNLISINSSASSHCDNNAVSYPRTNSWKQGTDCCLWDGVTCDGFTGHVTTVDLSSSWLHGMNMIEDNSSLFLLHNLEKLNLACNDFQGSRVSPKFGHFPHLTHLNLSSSHFSSLIPIEISQLSKLVSVDLSNNSLTLEQPNFFKFLHNLTELRELVFDFVDMSLVAPGSLLNLSSSLISLSLRRSRLQGEFPIEILHFPFLQQLTLSENIGLTGNFPMSNWSGPLRLFNLSATSFSGKLPDSIGNLRNLNVLDLHSCNFEGPIPASFWNLTQITSLDLTSNRCTGPIPASLSNLGQLTLLYLRHNNFSGQFPDVFGNLDKVKFLDFAQNNFSGRLPLSVFNLSQLSSLDFSDNQFVGQFPSQVSGLSSLRKLLLHNNHLNGTIPSWLFDLPSLEILGLGNNNFTGSLDQSLALAGSLKYILLGQNQIQGPIPNSIFKLVNLTFLDLSSNNLSGVHNMDMFSKLKNLKRVFLSSNNLLSLQSHSNVNFTLPKLEDFRCASCNITEFPSFLSASENLKFLDLSNNRIPGQISLSKSELWGNLFYLNLSNNLLTKFEHIPSMSLERLDLHSNLLQGPLVPLPPSMRFISFANNNLTGEIPSSFCNFDVVHIDLSNNSLSGMIPECLATSMGFISFANNYLSGEIPSSFCNFDAVQYIDLSDNSLSGMIPECLASYSELLFFSISHNNLVGAIPSSFCNLTSIRYLDLSTNSLYGSVPQCLGNSTTLQVLDLRMNNFHGSIPQTFASDSQLKTLNLNGNQIEGSLPLSLLNCRDLEVLDFGNNMINDTFPHWLAALSQLQVLILRSNRFHGPLGTSTGGHPFFKLRILDLSCNGFTSPLKSKFFVELEAMSRKNNSAELTYMGDDHYRDSIVVTMKGVEIEIQRILTILATMDLSSNKFEGRIPSVVGKLKSLKVLNFSHNNLIGHIPVSLKNLSELESLDLSSNRLEGQIPIQLISLTYLSFLNLSYNQLEGLIPSGEQFNTFPNDSYIGNLGLCGLPLSKKCSNNSEPELEPTKFHEERDTSSWFDWKIIMIGYGSGLVIGLSIGYIVFSTGKPWWFVSMVERKVLKLAGRNRRITRRGN